MPAHFVPSSTDTLAVKSLAALVSDIVRSAGDTVSVTAVFNLLPDNFKVVRFDSLASPLSAPVLVGSAGIVPVKPLSCKYRSVRFDKAPISLGMLSLRLLFCRYNRFRFVTSPICVGMEPVRPLFCRYKVSSFVSLPISAGMLPLRLLPSRNRNCNFVSFASPVSSLVSEVSLSSAGMEPIKPQSFK